MLQRLAPLVLMLCAPGCLASPEATTTPAEQPIRVLLFSGMNNHNYKATNPVIEGFLNEAGGFETQIVLDHNRLTADFLKDFDVIISNWSNWSDKTVVWSDTVQRDYVEFVRNGGGHFVFHAGGCSFYDWDDYFAICLMRWSITGPNWTGHGPHQHAFDVRLEVPDHPVTQGIELSGHTDELWNRPEIHADATVLASAFSAEEYKGTGQWEPVVIAGQFGEGRCVATTLGHDAKALANPELQRVFIQGLKWAAKPPVESD